jgi:hypothetical protein
MLFWGPFAGVIRYGQEKIYELGLSEGTRGQKSFRIEAPLQHTDYEYKVKSIALHRMILFSVRRISIELLHRYTGSVHSLRKRTIGMIHHERREPEYSR